MYLSIHSNGMIALVTEMATWIQPASLSGNGQNDRCRRDLAVRDEIGKVSYPALLSHSGLTVGGGGE